MDKEINFEESLKRLEEIVSKLEEGKSSLDESLKLYEEGVGLSIALQKKLKEVEVQTVKIFENGKEEDFMQLTGKKVVFLTGADFAGVTLPEDSSILFINEKISSGLLAKGNTIFSSLIIEFSTNSSSSTIKICNFIQLLFF